MLNFEYRAIPSTTGEVGGDEIYLGTPTGDNGELLWETPQGDGAVDPSDFCRAEEVYVNPRGRAFAFVALNVVSEEPELKYVIDDRRVDFDSATDKYTSVTAWYVPLGDGGPPPPPAITCFGLDRAVNRFFRRSPIAAVAPPVAWAGGDDRVVRTSDSAVAITAAGQLQGYVIDKTMMRIEHAANFTEWRRRGVVAKGPLDVAQGQAGVAIAYFEREVRLQPIDAIDHELFKLLHGRKLDLDALRRLIKTPVSDRPGGLTGPRTMMALAGLDKTDLTALRDRLRHLHERTAATLEITERVLRG
jgi:hypothetical protein